MTGPVLPSSTTVTLWFVECDEPVEAVMRGPAAGRGFGRKLLAQLQPGATITPIGQFCLNRSVPASSDEFYVAGYPGLTMLQTVIGEVRSISNLEKRLLQAVPADDIYATAINVHTGYGAFAHWEPNGKGLRRAFAARRSRVYEDLGLPEPFEEQYWSGELPGDGPVHRLDLPFDPIELAIAAQDGWLGFHTNATGPAVRVCAFATDGRPEPKIQPTPTLTPPVDHQAAIASAAKKLGLSPADRAYDDYEEPVDEPSPTNPRTLAEEASQLLGEAAGLAWAVGKHAGNSLRRRLTKRS